VTPTPAIANLGVDSRTLLAWCPDLRSRNLAALHKAGLKE
jgi:hypothetical protein